MGCTECNNTVLRSGALNAVWRGSYSGTQQFLPQSPSVRWEQTEGVSLLLWTASCTPPPPQCGDWWTRWSPLPAFLSSYNKQQDMPKSASCIGTCTKLFPIALSPPSPLPCSPHSPTFAPCSPSASSTSLARSGSCVGLRSSRWRCPQFGTADSSTPSRQQPLPAGPLGSAGWAEWGRLLH